MTHADFVHLRVHSALSLAEGAIHIDALAALCRQQAMPAVAVTDTNNLFAALEFSESMSAAGIQPVIGCCLALAPADDADQAPAGLRDRGPRTPAFLVLLARDESGYTNLMRLVSAAHLSSDGGAAPHTTLDDLSRWSAGLIAFTCGAEGPVGQLLQDGQRDKAEDLLGRLKALFPAALYMEIQRHGLAAEKATEEAFLDLAEELELPLVATNDVMFAGPDMYEAHDALLCIAAGAYVRQEDRRRVTPEHRFKTADEMRALFADLPEAIDNTLTIARRCAVRAPLRAPILPHFGNGEGASEADILRQLAAAGLERRLDSVLAEMPAGAGREAAAERYRARLAEELEIIIKMDFPGYFLIVADFIRWAKENGVPVGPGRGSGAGSVVAWALTITDLDPLRFGLLFERFLNPERVSMPDFDIDFCQEKRDRVISYVQQKYGHDQVAQIITFGKLQARAVMRDVGRVLEMPYGQVDRLCKMVPNNPANPVSLGEAIAGEPRLRAERDGEPVVARMLDMALKLEGLYRHASTHAAGVVIGDRPLEQLAPLYRDPRSDMPVTQFNMKWVEKAGLVKFDFLGLKTLTVIDRACNFIGQRGAAPDIAALPLDDRETFDLLSRGETVGIFQLEGTGMRDALGRLRPDKFEDIIALVALYRPGPMDNIPTYIKRKHGEEDPDYLHPSIAGILEETYGVIIYQEQVMQIAQVLAGYSLGEADLLRRAMGKKIAAEMDAQRGRFIDGAEKNGVEPAQASHIFDLVAKFAGYGFNKSHAAAYALIAYQTAWLKAHHPVEFMAASMSLDIGNTDKLAVFKAELGQMGVPLLAPDINRSMADFSVEETTDGLAVRYALAAIKNVGSGAMEEVVAEREKGGAFTDIFDFAERLDSRQVNKRMLENLIKAGALDALSPGRAQLLASVEVLLRHASLASQERDSSQTSLFGSDQTPRPHLTLAEDRDWNATETLEKEQQAIGFYFSGHPLDAYRELLDREGVASIASVIDDAGNIGRSVKVAGIVTRLVERKSARGNPYAFVGLSDPSGSFEICVFSELLASASRHLAVGNLLVATVEAGGDNGSMRMTGKRFRALDELAAAGVRGLSVRLADVRPLAELRAMLAGGARGEGRISLLAPLEGSAATATITLPGGWRLTPALCQAIEALPGIEAVIRQTEKGA